MPSRASSGCFTSKDPEKDEPGPDEIYGTGTMAVVHRMLRAPDGTIRLIVQGLERIRAEEYTQIDPYLRANVLEHPDLIEDTVETEALMRNAESSFASSSTWCHTCPRNWRWRR